MVLTVVTYLVENNLLTTAIFSAVVLISLHVARLFWRRMFRLPAGLRFYFFLLAPLPGRFLVSGMNLGVVTASNVTGVFTGVMLGRNVVNIFLPDCRGIGRYYSAIGGLRANCAVEGNQLPNYLSTIANFFILAITLNLTLRDLQNASNRMRRSNKELMAIREGLEQSVAERTRDLELAADVGRSMSQIRELDVLLQDAVNTIQKRFGLYYAQVYLTDRRQKTLSLKAGTGIVGRQLVRRGHVLSVGPGSINGTAAAEKRAIVVSNTAASPLFKPNSLLPYTRSEMAVPLILADRVLGVLNLQSDVKEGLTSQNIFAFETLAGQLAVAIENANLFTETLEARAQVEEYVGLMVREGWDSYQDGIVQPELLGFTFEGDALQRMTQPKAAPDLGVNRLDVPIVIANETIGTIQLEAEIGHVWTEEEREMATAVAQQVGQQAENLRLLAETHQYRAEAEQFARRLSGEAWRHLLKNAANQHEASFMI